MTQKKTDLSPWGLGDYVRHLESEYIYRVSGISAPGPNDSGSAYYILERVDAPTCVTPEDEKYYKKVKRPKWRE